jgi:hypothetical protein
VNPETFSEWLQRQGHHVFRTASSSWFDAGPRVLQAFPYHWIIQPSVQELRELIKSKGILALRYSTPLDALYGQISYHAVYEKASYTLDSLDRRSRQNVLKGLKNCCIEPISLARLAEEGWQLEKDTLGRQGRSTKQSEQKWRRRCMAAADLPGFEAWGALVEGHLAASLLTFQMYDCCEMLSQQCHRDHLRGRVNNALVFVVTQTMIKRANIKSIFYTLQSLDAPASIDEFKFRMGYSAKPVRQRVVLHPWFEFFGSRVSHSIVSWLSRLDQGNRLLAKAKGILAFHLQGKRPLDEQEWPECLTDHKARLLEI